MEISEKFLGLGHQVYGYLGELNLGEKFREIPENFSGIFLKKFLRMSQEYFSGNS